MILQSMWFTMVAGAAAFAFGNGMAGEMLEAALAGCENAIALTLRLGAGYLLFCGWMRIAEEAGAAGLLEKILNPLLRRLMPNLQREETRRAVTMNLSMNMLGLGNAATPKGLEAVRLISQEESAQPAVRHNLYMLLILNATSLQLLPTTVLTLRTAAGAANAQAVVLPTLLCTAASTLVGVLIGLWMKGRKK